MSPTRPQNRPDERIKGDVIANLKRDGRVDADALEATVKDGLVTLSGRTRNRLGRAVAAELARFTPGVRTVEDKIEVDMKRSTPGPDDTELAARANDVLQWHSDLEGSKVEAVVENGVVELEGSVDEHWKADRAHELLMGIRGTVEVKNNLAVVPTRDVADEVLAEEITTALRRTLLVDEDRVEVTVKKGVVTLGGRVSSWMESNTVREVVSSTPGVREIEDLLETDF